MRQQRERHTGRQQPGTTDTQRSRDSGPGADQNTLSAAQTSAIDQAATVRAATPESNGRLASYEGLPRLDDAVAPSHTGPRMSEPATGRRTSAPSNAPARTLPTRALAPVKANGERALARTSSPAEGAPTLIPGAKRYRPPAVSVTPRRSGPRSAVTQFAVSMVVTAILISALTLSTPLGQAAALDVTGPVHAYTNLAPWVPTPTPTPKPANGFRPPTSANPGKQAVINEIVSVFGPYAQGALAVSKCESGYDPNAWNSYPILNSHASGVFQILYPSTWNTTSYSSYSPFDASANIHAAYQIFKRDGYSWREWQCQP